MGNKMPKRPVTEERLNRIIEDAYVDAEAALMKTTGVNLLPEYIDLCEEKALFKKRVMAKREVYGIVKHEQEEADTDRIEDREVI